MSVDSWTVTTMEWQEGKPFKMQDNTSAVGFYVCTGDCMAIGGKWLIVSENMLWIRWHK